MRQQELARTGSVPGFRSSEPAFRPIGFGGRPQSLFRRHPGRPQRSEEHTAELQSLMRISYAVFCLTKKTTETTCTSSSRSQYLTTRPSLTCSTTTYDLATRCTHMYTKQK